jgi:hypothetical protein
MSLMGLGRVKTSGPRLREAGIPIVGGTFPGLSPGKARGWLGAQGGTLIAAISGWIPMIFMTRVRLYANTCRAISVATFGSRLVRKCVAS